MKTTTVIQYASMCLEALIRTKDRALTAGQISREQGLPQEEVRPLLEQFRETGIVSATTDGRYQLLHRAEDLQVLAILQAIFQPKPAPAFRPLWPACPERGMVGALRRTIGLAAQAGEYPGEEE